MAIIVMKMYNAVSLCIHMHTALTQAWQSGVEWYDMDWHGIQNDFCVLYHLCGGWPTVELHDLDVRKSVKRYKYSCCWRLVYLFNECWSTTHINVLGAAKQCIHISTYAYAAVWVGGLEVWEFMIFWTVYFWINKHYIKKQLIGSLGIYALYEPLYYI